VSSNLEQQLMLSEIELIEKLKELKIPAFRSKQILHALFQEGKHSYDQILVLPKELREKLKSVIPIFSIFPIKAIISKEKETEKVLFQLHDGLKVEAVLMRYKDDRVSLCISSQAGCQLGCTFCATGKMKFGRNLRYEEIADQVMYFAQKLIPEKKHITNIVYMGMGEPFMNYDEVMKSVSAINDKNGLNLGARKITISTAGICEGIEKLANEPFQVNLAISLHAPNQELRQKIMPIARRYSLDQLMKATEEYIEKTNRRVSYEYVMLRDINDHEKEAYELANLIKNQLCHVNLIPYNVTGSEGMARSERDNILNFRNILKSEGINATIRITLGQEIDAACGQLANKTE